MMIFSCFTSRYETAYSHHFVHFQESGAASDVRTEGAGKEALKKGEVPVKDNLEALAKERTKLIDRHGKVSKRIDGADTKLQNCSALIGNFLGGSELLQKAKAAYGEAEKTLARAKAKLPKIDVAAIIAQIPDVPKDTPEMADWKLKTKELPLPPEDQVALFQIEKNPDAAVVLYRQGEVFAARQGIKVMDAIKMLIDQVQSFATRQGIKVSDALAVYLANDSSSSQAQVPWPIFEKYFAALNSREILRDKPGIIAVIMALFPHYDEEKGLPMPVGTLITKFLVRDGSLAAVKYVSDLRQLGLSPEQILDYWDYKGDTKHLLRDSQIMRDLVNFQVQFPDLNNRFSNTPRKFIEVGRFLLTQSSELQPFLIYVIKNTGSISVEELKTFTKDPSLPVAIEVYKKLGNPYNERNPLETALRLARSLYFQGARGPADVPSNEVLIRQLYELKQLSARVAEWNLYGKEVIFIAGNDTEGKGVPKFHSPEILDQLAVSAGRRVEVEKAELKPSPEDLVALKQKILERMKNAPMPMTMCFNGHADSKGLSLDMSSREIVDGKYVYKPESYLSPFELADVVKFRSNKFHNDPSLAQDIYIFSACHSDELVRSVSGIIAAKGGMQPSFVSTSDFGLETTDGTEQTAMQLGKSPAKVAGIQKNKDGSSNITFYTPNSQGKLQQTVAG